MFVFGTINVFIVQKYTPYLDEYEQHTISRVFISVPRVSAFKALVWVRCFVLLVPQLGQLSDLQNWDIAGFVRSIEASIRLLNFLLAEWR